MYSNFKFFVENVEILSFSEKISTKFLFFMEYSEEYLNVLK